MSRFRRKIEVRLKQKSFLNKCIVSLKISEMKSFLGNLKNENEKEIKQCFSSNISISVYTLWEKNIREFRKRKRTKHKTRDENQIKIIKSKQNETQHFYSLIKTIFIIMFVYRVF